MEKKNITQKNKLVYEARIIEEQGLPQIVIFQHLLVDEYLGEPVTMDSELKRFRPNCLQSGWGENIIALSEAELEAVEEYLRRKKQDIRFAILSTNRFIADCRARGIDIGEITDIIPSVFVNKLKVEEEKPIFKAKTLPKDKVYGVEVMDNCDPRLITQEYIVTIRGYENFVGVPNHTDMKEFSNQDEGEVWTSDVEKVSMLQQKVARRFIEERKKKIHSMISSLRRFIQYCHKIGLNTKKLGKIDEKLMEEKLYFEKKEFHYAISQKKKNRPKKKGAKSNGKKSI